MKTHDQLRATEAEMAEFAEWAKSMRNQDAPDLRQALVLVEGHLSKLRHVRLSADLADNETTLPDGAKP